MPLKYVIHVHGSREEERSGELTPNMLGYLEFTEAVDPECDVDLSALEVRRITLVGDVLWVFCRRKEAK